MPATVCAGVNAKDGHAFYRVAFPAPRRIPARGHVALRYMGSPVLDFRYENGIPTVRPAAVTAGPPPAESKELSLEAGAPIGVCQTATREDIEADFAGYSALPDEKWIQLNSTADRFTLQMRLRKMPPLDIHRDLGGAYYIYGVETLVVHDNQKAAATPAGDKYKALTI